MEHSFSPFRSTVSISTPSPRREGKISSVSLMEGTSVRIMTDSAVMREER